MSIYKPYLEFIRYSLELEKRAVPDVKEMDWEGLFQFADEQGILGIMFQGLTHQIENGKLIIENYGHTDGTDHTDILSPVERAEIAERESGRPDMELMLEWGFWVQEIERRNREMNVAAVKLLRSLRKNGFDGCILKGQGNSLMYPKPYSRSSGDIDVWVMPKLNVENGKLNISQDVRSVIRFVKRRNPEARAVYHHILSFNLICND